MKYLERSFYNGKFDIVMDGELDTGDVKKVLEVLEIDKQPNDINYIERVNMEGAIQVIVKFGSENNITRNISRTSAEYYMLKPIREAIMKREDKKWFDKLEDNLLAAQQMKKGGMTCHQAMRQFKAMCEEDGLLEEAI